MTVEQSQPSIIVPLQPKGSRPPFFCIHGFGGGIADYKHLVDALGEDQPCYGIQPAGLYGDVEPDAEIEMMASRYADAMQAMLPNGPFLLGGYSFGAIVAFEVAQQLRQRGKNVGLLALFEGYAPVPEHLQESLWQNPKLAIYFVQNLFLWSLDFIRYRRDNLWKYTARGGRRVAGIVLSRLGKPATVDLDDILDHDPDSIPEHYRKMMQCHMQSYAQYTPQIYDGPITLICVRTRSPFSTPDPNRGWGKLTSAGVDAHIVPGSHQNVFTPPYVDALARELESCIVASQ